MKRYFILFVIFFLIVAAQNTAYADRNGFVNTVVIDAGHGGKDPGALGGNSKEKDLTLAIALKLGQYIEENLPDVKIIYTRDTDVFVPLNERAEIANKNKADLFISIHCNASPSSRAIGSETFIMGLHKTEANLEVAKKENAAILYEEDYKETYDGYDPNSSESHIIFSLYQNAHLNQSIEFASHIQYQFRERVRRVDRGVKQAPFLVLWRVTMPAILVEVGFIDNKKEEDFLTSESGQSYIASALFRAFRDYKKTQDQLASEAISKDSINNDTHLTTEENNDNSNTAITENIEDSNLEIENPSDAETITTDTSINNEVNDEVFFRVQFAASQNEISLDSPQFENLEGVELYFHEGLYKYTVGKEKTLQDAIKLQSKMQESGYPDAFVVAFYNNERISATKALELLQAKN